MGWDMYLENDVVCWCRGGVWGVRGWVIMNVMNAMMFVKGGRKGMYVWM